MKSLILPAILLGVASMGLSGTALAESNIVTKSGHIVRSTANQTMYTTGYVVDKAGHYTGKTLRTGAHVVGTGVRTTGNIVGGTLHTTGKFLGGLFGK